MPYYEYYCPNCNQLNDVSESACGSCGITFLHQVNVRRSLIPAEREALEKRYKSALSELSVKSLDAEVNLLETVVIDEGKAVLNLGFDFLWDWLMYPGKAYQSYRRTVAADLRKRATFENDLKRSSVESLLFGSHVDIIYAALTVDQSSVRSYGPVTVVLRNSTIENRTSMLEKNSFFFVNDAMTIGWTFGKPLPVGFMAQWSDRHKLAVAKLKDALKKDISSEELADAILSSDGNRAADEFMELYIYGNIISTGVEKIKIPLSLSVGFDAKAQAQLNELKLKYVVEVY